MMERHYLNTQYHGLAFLVIGLEVLSGLALLFGGIGSLYMMFTQQGSIFTFIIVSFGGIVAAFVVFALAEFLSLMIKIEYNTRRTEELIAKKRSR